MTLPSRTSLLVCASAAGLVLLAGLLPVFLGSTFFGVDLHYVDMGMICSARTALAEGTLSLSATHGNGAPLLANPHTQYFYPLRWIAWPLGPEVGASVVTVLHLAVAAASMSWLLRTYRARPDVALAIGVAFAASGTAVDIISHSTYIVGLTWLPAAWASGRLFLSRGQPAALAATACCLTLLIVGGEPQAFGFSIGVLALEGIARAKAQPHRAFVLLASIGCAFGLALPQLLPTLLESSSSARMSGGEGLFLDEPADVATWIGLVVPLKLSEPLAGGVSLGEVFHEGRRWNQSPFIGFVILSLAGLGSVRAWKHGGRPAIIIAFGSLACALVPQALSVLGTLVPVVARFRWPEKYLMPATVALFLLAGLGLDRLRRHATRPRLLVAFAPVGLAAIAMVVASLRVDALEAAQRAAATMDAAGASASELVTGAAARGLFAAGLVALVVALPRLRRFVCLAVAVGVVVEGVGFANIGPRAGDLASLSLPPEAIACPTEVSRTGHVHPTGEVADLWSHYVASWASGRYTLSACHAFRKASNYGPLRHAIHTELEAHIDDPRTMQAMGCTHAVEFQEAPTRVTLRPLPRAEPGARVIEVPLVVEAEELKARILASDDPRSLLSDPWSRLKSEVPPSTGELRGVRWEADDHAILDVTGTGPVVVSLSRAASRGWRATQGTRELPVVFSGAGLIAVVVEDAGLGPVELGYAPPGLGLGFAVAGLALVALAGLMWLTRRRSRRPRD